MNRKQQSTSYRGVIVEEKLFARECGWEGGGLGKVDLEWRRGWVCESSAVYWRKRERESGRFESK